MPAFANHCVVRRCTHVRVVVVYSVGSPEQFAWDSHGNGSAISIADVATRVMCDHLAQFDLDMRHSIGLSFLVRQSLLRRQSRNLILQLCLLLRVCLLLGQSLGLRVHA